MSGWTQNHAGTICFSINLADQTELLSEGKDKQTEKKHSSIVKVEDVIKILIFQLKALIVQILILF